ncbi:MAG: peptidyl-prolyl cis-trans isomerase C [Arenicella sp.]|jgi:peptidyl-prolyl cis-trans isomerase C
MTTASARHILVSTEQACLDIQTKINAGEKTFEAAAAELSQCPSGKQGGDLGSFGPGMMVPEFDQVVFNEEVGKVHGPVKTQFGFHLVEITQRDS